MSRLLPCSSCARHVRMSERACPFCGALVNVAASQRLIVALVGLSLIGCTSGAETRAKAAENTAGEAKSPVVEQPAVVEQARVYIPTAERTERPADPVPMYGGARLREPPEAVAPLPKRTDTPAKMP